ncbi:MAG: hypothetical protein KBT36_13330 [Kurthia sp.]|nr:hypothetical protein [Candidatus Kurthia equi]
MKKAILSIFTIFTLLFCTLVPVDFEKSNSANARTDMTYSYWFKSGQPKYIKTEKSSWKRPLKSNGKYKYGWAYGPMKENYSYSTKATWSINGSATIPYKSVETTLGSEYTSEKSYSIKTSCVISKKQKSTPKFRIKYKVYKQTYAQWISIDGKKSKTGKTKVVTFKTPVDYDKSCGIVKK